MSGRAFAGGSSAFAAELDFPAPFAGLALSAAATCGAGNSAPEVIDTAGKTFSGEPANAVADRAIPVAGRIAFVAQMGGHAAPPKSSCDSDRVSPGCQTRAGIAAVPFWKASQRLQKWDPRHCGDRGFSPDV